MVMNIYPILWPFKSGLLPQRDRLGTQNPPRLWEFMMPSAADFH